MLVDFGASRFQRTVMRHPVGQDVFDSIDVEKQGTLTKSGIAKVQRGNPEAQAPRDIRTDYLKVVS